MSEPYRLLVFHRNCLFRDCLVELLAHQGKFDATSVDHTVSDAAKKLLVEPCDLVLLDLNLPDNLAVGIARELQQLGTATKVVVLVPDEHDTLVECIAAGAHGCVLERSSLKELDSAIEKVLAGETFCSTEIVSTMFAQLAKMGVEQPWCPASASSITRLTVREQEVLDLLAKRMSNKQIAKELCVSLFTVKNHVHNILEKLEVESRVEAVDAARRHPASILY